MIVDTRDRDLSTKYELSIAYHYLSPLGIRKSTALNSPSSSFEI